MDKCRSCLTSSPKSRYYSLLTVFPEFVRNSLSILDLLETVTSSKVTVSDNLPSVICLNCFKSVKSAYSFIIAFKHSQNILSQSYPVQEDNNKNNELFLDSEGEHIIIVTEENNINANKKLFKNISIFDKRKHPEFVKVKPTESKEPTFKVLRTEIVDDDDDLEEVNDLKEGFDSFSENNDLEEEVHNLGDDNDLEENNDNIEGEFDDLEYESADLEEINDDVQQESDLEEETDDPEHEMEENIKPINIKEETNITFDDDADRDIIEMEEIIIMETKPDESLEVQKQMPKIFKCDFCKNTYTAQRNLLAHMKRKHSEHVVEYRKKLSRRNLGKLTLEKTYKCKLCDKVFSSRAELSIHNNNYHHPEWKRIHKCDICNEHFRSRNALNYHNLAVHIGKKFTCHVCGKKFITPSTLKQHILNVHEGKAPEKYLCSICGRGFKYNTALKYHMGKVHTNQRDFICGYCGATFILLGELRCHERNHTGERPFSCQYCEKTFKRSTEQQKHEKTHLGIYPYKCDYCDGARVFTSTYNMKIHWLQHRGQYECDMCEKNFASDVILKFHYSHKHKIKDVVIGPTE